MATKDMTPVLSYEDGSALMEYGSEVLHSDMSARIEAAMGKTLPQMEVRFQNLSVSARINVSSESQSQELPTLWNEFKKSLRGLSASKTPVTKHILKDINGVLKPGTMTLVLGQPGSGKSSLMKVLSGRFPMAKNVTLEGDVSYNGTPQQEIAKRLSQFVSYVTQRDHHFPTLTVKETLEFAYACCGHEFAEHADKLFTQGTADENKVALEAAMAIAQHYPDVILQQLGLTVCQDTIVGDAMVRGISGGERKRVTTGEMQFGSMYVSLMDEISTGLDSAATFDIIKTQRSIAKNLRKTVVIALLQPSPEVLALFDDVLILNDGHVMYHGPRDQVVEYFAGLGFHCPPSRDVADYLLDLGTREQHQYEVPVENTALGRHPRRPREFADLFRQSAIYRDMLAALEAPLDPALLNDNAVHFDSIPEFYLSFAASTKLLVVRELTKIARNTAFIMGRAVMVIVMGLLYATVFWQFDAKDAQVVMGIMFATVLFLGLGQAAQIPTYMDARAIFYKQRAANFYRTQSYVLAASVSQVPLAILETLLFGSLVYWMCGFVADVGAYVIFELLLFLTTLAFAAWFFFLTAAVPNMNVANSVAMMTILFFVLFAGFVMTKDQIPDYLVWIFWINPIAWCLRSVAINQYRNGEFDVDVYGGVDYYKTYGQKMGVYSLGIFRVESEKAWLWYGFIFLVAAYILFMWLSYFMLEYKRYESPENVGLDENEDGVDARQPISSSSAISTSATGDFALVETPRKDQGSTGASADEVAVTVAPNNGRERQFVPVTLAFKDLWYSVPHPSNPKTETLDLLKGISGYAHPGTVTALMGSSGAGKTTLMDVIAGRKTGGKIRGQILLNGHEASDLAIRRGTGYCEQMDIHSEASTIREALTFSAFLRQGGDVSDSDKFDSVNECLELLDLHPIADQIIRGSSVEQMKRLTIGVELAAQPSVLFLDEPTSGLDARSAKVIMNGIRKVADTGRTVVCTIHQPSTAVFFMFDRLLLLKRGGEMVYVGDLGRKASEMVQYFESISGVEPISKGYNPATWMLEVIGAGVGNAAAGEGINFVAEFNASEKRALLDQELNRDGVMSPSPNLPALSFSSKRAASEWTQAKFVVGRFMDLYWRTASYNLTRLLISIIVGLIFGICFLSVDYKTYQGVNAGEGMIFMTSLFVGAISYNSILPIAAEERASFYRERAAQTYNALWYFVGSTVAEIPYVFFSTLAFMAVFFPTVGFTGGKRFLVYWIAMSLHVLTMAYMGQLFAYALPSIEVAAIVGVLFISVFVLFMGFNPPADAIPSGYKWLYHIVPPKYSYAILSATIFADCPDDHAPDSTELACQQLRDTPPTVAANVTVREFVEDVFATKHDDIAFDFAIVIAVIILFRVLALLSLRYINHQKR